MREWLDQHWRGALAEFQKFADDAHDKERSK